MKNYKFILALLAPLFVLSCKNNKSGTNTSTPSTKGITPPVSNELMTKGILNNKTGLDGCGWVIKLYEKDKHGREYLDPSNLKAFTLPLTEGKAVEVLYIEENSVNTCMIGTIITLKSIKAL